MTWPRRERPPKSFSLMWAVAGSNKGDISGDPIVHRQQARMTRACISEHWLALSQRDANVRWRPGNGPGETRGTPEVTGAERWIGLHARRNGDAEGHPIGSSGEQPPEKASGFISGASSELWYIPHPTHGLSAIFIAAVVMMDLPDRYGTLSGALAFM